MEIELRRCELTQIRNRKYILNGGYKMNGNRIASVLCSVATILNIIAGNLEIAIITSVLSLLNTLVA